MGRRGYSLWCVTLQMVMSQALWMATSSSVPVATPNARIAARRHRQRHLMSKGERRFQIHRLAGSMLGYAGPNKW